MITYELQTVLEMDWNTFLMNKRWHSRMHAWNLSLTKQVRQQCKIVYKKQDKNTIRLPRQYLEESRKASKINGFTEQEGAYYTTATPFLKAP